MGSAAPTPQAAAASKVATHPAQNSREHRDKNGDEPAPHKPKKVDPFDALLEPFYYNKSLTDPIDTARDKWNLLPAFLKVKGLVKQHIDSYNYFVEVQLKKILRANSEIRSSENRSFFIKYVLDFHISRFFIVYFLFCGTGLHPLLADFSSSQVLPTSGSNSPAEQMNRKTVIPFPHPQSPLMNVDCVT